MRWIWLAGLVVLGCESGLSRQVEVTLPSGLAGGFSQTAPGIVMSDLGSDAGRPYLALCGQTPRQPLVLSQDLGFGCLRESPGLEGTTETVRAWVQPMPASFSAAEVCAHTDDRSFYSATSFGPDDAGESDAGQSDGGPTDAGELLAPTPAPTWAQGSGTGTWHRDGSPCGGAMNAKLTVAQP